MKGRWEGRNGHQGGNSSTHPTRVFNVTSCCDCVPGVLSAIVARIAKTVSIDTLSY